MSVGKAVATLTDQQREELRALVRLRVAAQLRVWEVEDKIEDLIGFDLIGTAADVYDDASMGCGSIYHDAALKVRDEAYVLSDEFVNDMIEELVNYKVVPNYHRKVKG